MFQILIILVFILTPRWEAAHSAMPSAASQPRQHRVEIHAFQFMPQQISVAPGDTIVWINRDIVPHTVIENGGTWRSPPLEEGQSWKIVVERNGLYTYFCEFHPHMTGILTTR